MLSLTGLKMDEFCLLASHFSIGYQKQLDSSFKQANKIRIRKAGGGRKGTLVSMEQKLFFILYYLKVYPTYDVLALSFGMARSKACENSHKLALALYFSLQELAVVPAREINSIDEMQQVFKDLKTILIDASDRPYLRSKDAIKQKATYTGKKKAYT